MSRMDSPVDVRTGQEPDPQASRVVWRGHGLLASRDSGLGRVPQEELALRRRVRAADVFLRGAQVAVEVGEDDRRLVEEERLDLAGDAPLAGEVHRGDELLRERVVAGL